jgi:hypothetical protein
MNEVININPQPQVTLVPVFETSLQEVKARLDLLQSFVKDYMIPDEDYGIIPGTDKPSLLKPGGEKLCDIYGLSKKVDIINKVEDYTGKTFPEELTITVNEWVNNKKTKVEKRIKIKAFFEYEVRVTLTNKRTGLLEAEGLASCNTLESKYITQDPYSVKNTILKMAKKRALVDATLSATRTSGLFSQDMDEIGEPPKTGEDDSAMTVKEAFAFKMPFGPNKGKTIGDIYNTDKNAFKWCLEKCNNDSVKEAARIVEVAAIEAQNKKAAKTEEKEPEKIDADKAEGAPAENKG